MPPKSLPKSQSQLVLIQSFGWTRLEYAANSVGGYDKVGYLTLLKIMSAIASEEWS